MDKDYQDAIQPLVKVGPLHKSDSTAQIDAALAEAQKDIKPAVKDSDNPFFRSKYANLPSVWEACREALTKQGIAVIQPASNDDKWAYVETTLRHKGEWYSMTLSLPLIPVRVDRDTDDKRVTAQVIAAAITYGRRVGLGCMGMVTAEEDDDGNTASGNPQPAQAKAVPFPAGPFESTIASITRETKAAKATGKPFTVYHVQIDGYGVADTLSEKLIIPIQNLAGTGTVMSLTVEKGQYGYNLMAAKPMQTPEAAKILKAAEKREAEEDLPF